MAIKIPGSAFQGISSLGSSIPDAGYYDVTIVDIETGANDKPGTRRFHVQFDNGFKMFTFFSLPFDDNGQQLPGLTEKQVRGRMAAIRTVLESLGYSKEDIENAAEINDNWFLGTQNGGRKAYVEFLPGQKGVQGSYSEIKTWLTKQQFDALKAADAKPADANVAPAVSASPVPSAAPTNGAPIPSAGVALPPPASAAQNIVS